MKYKKARDSRHEDRELTISTKKLSNVAPKRPIHNWTKIYTEHENEVDLMEVFYVK